LADPAGEAPPLTDAEKKKKKSARANKGRAGRPGGRRDDDDEWQRAEKDRIRAKHDEKEKDLIDGLHAQVRTRPI
jgi:hypothetical protein